MKLRHLSLALLLISLAVWGVVLRPTALGGPASYLFVSGVSMQPTLESGDLVVLQRADEYVVGDIVAFEIPAGVPGAGALVIHRIIGGSAEDGFVMQGDNMRVRDEWRPTGDLVAGRLWLHLPGGGAAVAWLRQPSVFASALAGLVVFFVVLGDGGPKLRRKVAVRE